MTRACRMSQAQEALKKAAEEAEAKKAEEEALAKKKAEEEAAAAAAAKKKEEEEAAAAKKKAEEEEAAAKKAAGRRGCLRQHCFEIHAFLTFLPLFALYLTCCFIHNISHQKKSRKQQKKRLLQLKPRK